MGDILVTAGTAPIRHDDTTPVAFTALKVGDRVHVTGTATGVGTLTPGMTASLIIVQNTNPKVPVNLKGAVSGVTGNCAPARFVVEGWTVEAAASVFQKGTCAADLKNGAEVHVKGDVIPATTSPVAAAFVRADWVQFGK